MAISATAMPTMPTIIEKIEANPPLISGDAARINPIRPNGIDSTAKTSPQIGRPEQERNMLPNEASTARIALVPMRCGGRSEYLFIAPRFEGSDHLMRVVASQYVS